MNTAKPGKTRTCLARAAAALLALGAATAVQADIILDAPNVNGTIGLAGETFGYANFNASWSGGSVGIQLPNGDHDFAVRVEPGKTFNLNAYMYSFQGTYNANLYQYLRNIPALGADEVRNIELTRTGGRIRGYIDVTGGTVRRVQMYSSGAQGSNESYFGNVTVGVTPFEAVQPFPALTNVRVYGSATLAADAGCDVPVTLTEQYVDVPAGSSVSANWSFDLSDELCDLGSLEGTVALTGLDGDNADVRLDRHRVYANGPVSRNLSLYDDGDYVFTDLVEGTYYVSHQSYFLSPYSYLSYSSTPVPVLRGQVSTHDMLRSVGTAHGLLEATGTWDVSTTSQFQLAFRDAAGSGYAYDNVDPGSGAYDLVLPAGDSYLQTLYNYFYMNDGVRVAQEYYYHNYYNASHSPAAVTLGEGGRVDAGTIQIETSEAEQVFQLAVPEVGIRRLTISGYENLRDPVTNAGTESKSITLLSNLTGTGVPTNAVTVLIRGEPGTYMMTATADGDDGGSYSTPFELVLGQPQNTPVGQDVSQDYTTESGESIGSVTFGNVSGSGETTVSLSSSGPQSPANFKVFGGGVAQFYDIRSTAEFDEALICLDYDDSEFNGNDSLEAALKLSHYVCPDETNTNCVWESITADGYPDITANTICGLTSSFSIFAMLLPLDQDGDGVVDADDNCPQTSNAGQEDQDGDGFGDACDSDTDGDGIVDDEDTCPYVASDNNDDLDGDGDGDVCDTDDDGDGLDDPVDNCPRNANASQADFDSDGSGDACDLDDDNDGVDDSADDCPGTVMGVLIEGNGCSSPQLFDLACPADDDYKNHGKYVSCVAGEATRQMDQGLISSDEKDAAVSTAAKSTIGK